VQPDVFRHQFYPLAITKNQVEEAIHSPDDYQHLMTEDALVDEDDVFSIFMKKNLGQKRMDPNRLLVQSFRQGLEQVAQSAWRIYSSDVDLRSAQEPLDVLRAFADAFGVNVTVGDLGNRSDTAIKFVYKKTFPKSPLSDETSFLIGHENVPGAQLFSSWSHRKTTNPSIFHVGIAYTINLTRYRASLISHGASVR
jgi:hypothetical protein